MFGTHRKFPDKFFLYYRMSTSFDELLNLICDKTMKTDTNMRKSIDPVERLAVTLRVMASTYPRPLKACEPPFDVPATVGAACIGARGPVHIRTSHDHEHE